MGDVIDIGTKSRYMGDDGIDPHDEIDLTITIATALVLISHINLIHQSWPPDDDSPILDDFMMDLQNEIWPEEE